MNAAAKYAKIVAWSDEGRRFVGSCPGLFCGGRHGDDQQAVFIELCQIVEETGALSLREGRTLPPPAFGCDWANPVTDTTSHT